MEFMAGKDEIGNSSINGDGGEGSDLGSETSIKKKLGDGEVDENLESIPKFLSS